MNWDTKFEKCRNSIFRVKDRRYLLSRIENSSQEEDLSMPPNCNGYGRIHHFRRQIDENWIVDPLPIDPACKSLGIPYRDMLETQVFQVAACNLRCWYCFVPDALKCADISKAKWFNAEELVELFIQERTKSLIIDLSGGNPELVPEWIHDMMKALEKLGLMDSVYLWSDDTLTTDYLFRYLTTDELNYICSYPHYGKVGCFKGYNASSFAYNTGLPSDLYDRQFEMFHRQLSTGIDMYGYATFTSFQYDDIKKEMSNFVDKLQRVHELLPLRVIPLKIQMYTPIMKRKKASLERVLSGQFCAIEQWKEEMTKRFHAEQLSKNICDISLR